MITRELEGKLTKIMATVYQKIAPKISFYTKGVKVWNLINCICDDTSDKTEKSLKR